ncbi:MAG TPA: hypothetical protein VFT80_14020 [Actinomycetota bacterium]|nr:hypothetical protein [Actinomycetota bacterium]
MHEHDMQAMSTSDWVWMTPTLLSWVVPIVLGVFLVGVFVGGDALSVTSRWRRMGRFLCHTFGMTVAMMLGMVVLATTFTWYDQTELAALTMASGMTLPMLALMRYRGHTWRRCCEMATAMLVPTLALLALFWLGALAGHLVVPLQMLLMLPAMMAVMLYRADQYTDHACTVRP